MSLTLLHNGAPVDLAAARAELGALVRSFVRPDSLTVRRAIAFDEPTDWQAEDSMALLLDGTPVFAGRIQATERVASPEGEWVAYTCLGLRAQADAVPFRRVIGGAPTARVVYNCPREEAPGEAGFLALPGTEATVGQIVADILDAMAPELAGVLGDGSPGSAYVQADLDALAVVPPKLVLCGESVDAALRSALRYAPDFGFTVDPATRRARFVDLRALEPHDVPGLGAAVLRHHLAFSTDRCYSACVVEADFERVDILEELAPAWDPSLEADWTPEKAAQLPDTYGAVWRLFDTAEPAQAGGVLAPERCVGDGDILVTLAYPGPDQTHYAVASAEPVQGTRLLLDRLARRWDPAAGAFARPAAFARFTYLKGRLAARYPAAGHTGSAHARRGLERELLLVHDERGKATLRGTVHEVLSPASFRVLYGLAPAGELAGLPLEFHGDGVPHTIAANDEGTVTLAAPPARAIQPGDPFVVTLRDDTARRYEGGTLSALELFAREQLERVMDERVAGAVPLTGLDWSLRLGQKINFPGTRDPDYTALGALLIALEHDLAHERTVLHLTRERAAGYPTWDDLERERRQTLDTEELARQLRRLWRRRRRGRRVRLGPADDPHVVPPGGPVAGLLVGDGTWLDLTSGVARHIGPGPAETTIGGPGQYIQWIALDARKHVVDAAAGTFS
ncbi:MAG TPA: hypothetical protein P5532_23710 [Planctomycetota bacterium]|nr:hypothetical protein [Planctomycetota bacterium]